MQTQKPDLLPESMWFGFLLFESVYENYLDWNIPESLVFLGVIGDSTATSVRRRSSSFRLSSWPIRRLCSRIWRARIVLCLSLNPIAPPPALKRASSKTWVKVNCLQLNCFFLNINEIFHLCFISVSFSRPQSAKASVGSSTARSKNMSFVVTDVIEL